jgi:hypothetical protein
MKRSFEILWSSTCALSVICLFFLPELSYIFTLPDYWGSFIFLGVSFLGGLVRSFFLLFCKKFFENQRK